MHTADRVRTAYHVLNSAQRLDNIELIKQAKKVLQIASKSEDEFITELTIFTKLKDKIKRQMTQGRRPNY